MPDGFLQAIKIARAHGGSIAMQPVQIDFQATRRAGKCLEETRAGPRTLETSLVVSRGTYSKSLDCVSLCASSSGREGLPSRFRGDNEYFTLHLRRERILFAPAFSMLIRENFRERETRGCIKGTDADSVARCERDFLAISQQICSPAYGRFRESRMLRKLRMLQHSFADFWERVAE